MCAAQQSNTLLILHMYTACDVLRILKFSTHIHTLATTEELSTKFYSRGIHSYTSSIPEVFIPTQVNSKEALAVWQVKTDHVCHMDPEANHSHLFTETQLCFSCTTNVGCQTHGTKHLKVCGPQTLVAITTRSNGTKSLRI